ncbi:UNVERIFIED_ORG: hypothetical protein M2425_002428 [Bradyrhizobium japonicum]
MTSKPPIDLLATFARFGREQRMSLRDPNFAETFTGIAKERLAEALDNDILLHGQRTENMFEALIVSLGHYKLLKREDIGVVHPEGAYTAPDFRVHLHGGAKWLIEVKNVYDADPGRQRFRIRQQDFDHLKSYASAMDCPLKFALYWARWRTWMLIDADDLVPIDGKLGIDMFKAAPLNEMARLGDRMIGTKPPLKLRLFADKTKPRSLSADGEAALTVSHAAVFCGDTEITDQVERNIAWILMEFGDWECGDPGAAMNGDELRAVEFQWTPRERINEPEEFDMIGTLSSMFSRYYATKTLGRRCPNGSRADAGLVCSAGCEWSQRRRVALMAFYPSSKARR